MHQCFYFTINRFQSANPASDNIAALYLIMHIFNQISYFRIEKHPHKSLETH